MTTISEIFSRPRSSDEDEAVRYAIRSKDSEASLPLAEMQVFAESLLPNNFIWHRDAFELGPDGTGRVRVGDAVDDEWLLVWILREISRRWSNVAISIVDANGDFMLIEAADHLPRWISPENSINRVWISQGRLHIVPPEVAPIVEDQDLPDRDAVKLVLDTDVNTFAPTSTEIAVWSKIDRYPDAFRSHTHVSRAYLPSEVALALSADPRLIQRAVEAFYMRDAIGLRAVQKMSRFPPSTTSAPVSVRMTRPAYAQVVGQKFYPPRVFGSWDTPGRTTKDEERRWRDVGMKIACGFEILYQESKSSGVSPLKFDASSRQQFQQDKGYRDYIANITRLGYFGDNLEGSQGWNERESRAREIYIATISQNDRTRRKSFAQLVNSAVEVATSQPPPADLPEDSEDWLNVNPDEFDSVLESAFIKSDRNDDTMDVDGVPENDEDANAEKLQTLAKRVESFVGGEGDLEGALLEDDVAEFDSDDEDDEDDEQDEEARSKALENLVPALEPSEYGKMPKEYYSNSQSVTQDVDITDPAGILQTEKDIGEVLEMETESARRIREPLLIRDKYEGVDSDDESSASEDAGGGIPLDEEGDGLDDESRPTVVGEEALLDDIDMGLEQDEFISFARAALGVDDALWSRIVEERKERGAFVPSLSSDLHDQAKSTQAKPSRKAKFSDMPTKPAQSDVTSSETLDSFESVMQAMDQELARAKQESSFNSNKGKGKAKAPLPDTPASQTDAMDTFDQAEMDAELRASLLREDESDDEFGGDGEGGMDYNLIKNFLESFKGQDGLPGPASSLLGRLGGAQRKSGAQ